VSALPLQQTQESFVALRIYLISSVFTGSQYRVCLAIHSDFFVLEVYHCWEVAG